MKALRRYLFYMLYFLSTIPLVILLFKFIEPKKLASLFAASLFISCSLLVFWGELRLKVYNSYSLIMAAVFFLLFSAPMITVRLIHYELDFSQINIAGMTGDEFHRYSNYGFILLVASSIVDFFLGLRLSKTTSHKKLN